jgi:hypothetical protein
MTEPLENSMLPEKSTETTLGRRELLKALAATGGAVTAASLVPGEWAKPVIEAGLLPAHAQASPVPVNFTLAVLRSNPGSNIGNVTTTGNGPAPCQIEIEVQMTPVTEGVNILLEVTDPPGSSCGDNIQPTDVLGVASFVFDATCVAETVAPRGGPTPAPFTLQFSFVDTATYGDDTATLSAEVTNIFACLD